MSTTHHDATRDSSSSERAAVWSGTSFWYDAIWISKDTVFDSQRAVKLGVKAHSNAAGLAANGSYTESYGVSIPPGYDGQYYIYVITDANGGYGYSAEQEIFEGGYGQSARELYPKILILARSEYIADALRAKAAGADVVVAAATEVAFAMSEHLLTELGATVDVVHPAADGAGT